VVNEISRETVILHRKERKEILFSPRKIHPNMAAKRKGPGPCLALTYRKNEVPKKMNIDRITDG
jgi:hypothetical protein